MPVPATPPADSSAKPRAPLSRERVLRAAVELADESGIESLTMRRLGQALGVEAMSLYNHVANKDDLLDGIIDLVLGEIELSPAPEDWEPAMRATAISAHDILLRHPWACSLILSPTTIRIIPARMRYIESVLRRLREAGFSAELTYHGYHALDSHILGFTLWQIGHSIDTEKLPDFVATVLRELPVDEYPYLLEHAEQHFKDSGPGDVSEFEFGLDLILDGLKRLAAGRD
jgi:AcrR family transcriptional regulator